MRPSMDPKLYALLIEQQLGMGFVPIPKNDVIDTGHKLGLANSCLKKSGDTDTCCMLRVGPFTVYAWINLARIKLTDKEQYLGWVLTVQDNGSYSLDIIRYTSHFSTRLLRSVYVAVFRCRHRPHCPHCGKPMNILHKPSGGSVWNCSNARVHSEREHLRWNDVGEPGELDTAADAFVAALKPSLRPVRQARLSNIAAHVAG